MTSLIWRCFQLEDDPSKARCRSCSMIISRGTRSRTFNTTNMWRHIRRNNGACNLIDESPRPTQPTLVDVIARRNMLPSDHRRALDITIAIAEMMALDLQPFSVVQDDGFVRLMHILEPRYQIPSRTTFSRTTIPHIYGQLKTNIGEQIHSSKSKITITSDGWTSRDGRCYLAVTAHWISRNNDLKMALISLENIEERHTGENLAASIRKAIETWFENGLDDTFAMTTDNAANMLVASRNLGVRHQGCMAHTLNLVMDKALKTQHTLFAKCRAIASALHRSPKSSAALRKAQDVLGIPQKTVKQDISTRWNSEYYMVKSILEQKAALMHVAQNQSVEDAGKIVDTVRNISYEKWDVMPSVIKVLAPFEEATRRLSLETDSICDAIPIILSLRRVIEKLMVDDSLSGVSSLLQALFSGINERFASIEANIEYQLATVLDPRYKLKFGGENSDDIVAKLKQRVDEAIGEPREIQAEQPMIGVDEQSDISIGGALAQMLSEQSEHSRPLERPHPVESYLADALSAPDINPVQFWGENEQKYPELYKLAMNGLACPSTSVASERVFSTVGNIIDERRSRLTPQNVETLAFVKYNLNL